MTFWRIKNKSNINANLEENVLCTRCVGKFYKKRSVLVSIDISVRCGESVGLLGPNGAGKTTLFYIVMGIVKTDSGRIFLGKKDITKYPMHKRSRAGIGYLPQEASIFRGMTVENNIMAVLEIVEKNARLRRKKLEELLDEFSITHLRSASALTLSGGERRRVEIARTLAISPSFILLDEPFAGVDPIAVADIRRLVSHLKDKGIGVLITDHNVQETLKIIDRAVIIHDGRVLMQGTPEAIVNNEDVRRYYLGENFLLHRADE